MSKACSVCGAVDDLVQSRNSICRTCNRDQQRRYRKQQKYLGDLYRSSGETTSFTQWAIDQGHAYRKGRYLVMNYPDTPAS